MNPGAVAHAGVAARVALVLAVVLGEVATAALGPAALVVFNVLLVAGVVLAWMSRQDRASLLSVRELRYRTILESAGQSVFEVDGDGCWTYLGANYSEVLGLDEVPAIGDACRDSLPPDMLPMLAEAWRTLRADPSAVVRGEVAYADDDGRVRTLEWYSVARHDGRRPIGAVGTVRDVTAQRSQEQLADAVDRREQKVIDALPDGVLLYDATGRVVRSNPRARDMAGRDLIGTAAGDVPRFPLVDVLGRAIGPTESPVMVVLQTGEAVDDVVIGVDRPEGRSWRRMSALPLPPGLDGGAGVVVTMRDITEDMAHLEELGRARGEAERANQAKTEFMSRLHHEIRTPLNAVYTAAQLLDERELPEAERRIAARILKGCRLAIGLMEDLREISLIEDGRVRLRHDAVDVADAVTTAMAAVDHLSGRTGVRVQVEPIDPRLRVWADAKRLAQVLVNLLTNAIKYNRPDGRVGVRVEVGEGRLRILVSDTGRGIGPGDRERVFEPFERLDAARTGVEGTGLGLSISRRLVDTMDGTLTIGPEQAEGTTFIIDLVQAPSLPTAAASTPPERARHDHDDVVARAPIGPVSVLYIEDNPDNVELMHDVLQRWPNVVVHVAMTGQEGLAQAAELHPSVILLDLHLPDLHGLQVLEALRSQPATATIPVIMVTADATGWEQEVPASQRPDAIVTKPLDVKSFARVLSGWLEPTPAA